MTDWTLSDVTIALAILFAVHTLAVVPWLRQRLKSAPNDAKPKWAAAVLVAETSQLVCLAALISAGVTWAALWAVTLGSTASAGAIARVVDRIQAAQHIIDETKAGLWLWAFVAAAIALLYSLVRRRRAQFEKARVALRHAMPLRPTPTATPPPQRSRAGGRPTRSAS